MAYMLGMRVSRTGYDQPATSWKNMSDHPLEQKELSEQYGIDARHEDDLKRQLEQISAFEEAARSGDWKLFKRIVNRSGKQFLKLMRGSDGDPRLRLPLFQSGELEASFSKSLQDLNKDWTHLMPWWARFAYRFEVALTWTAAAFVLGAVGAAVRESPETAGILGAVALVLLVAVDNAEPGVRSYSRWWVRLVYLNPRSVLSRWRTLGYIVASLMIMWFFVAPTFKTARNFCDDLSPAELAVYRGCGADDPFAN